MRGAERSQTRTQNPAQFLFLRADQAKRSGCKRNASFQTRQHPATRAPHRGRPPRAVSCAWRRGGPGTGRTRCRAASGLSAHRSEPARRFLTWIQAKSGDQRDKVRGQRHGRGALQSGPGVPAIIEGYRLLCKRSAPAGRPGRSFCRPQARRSCTCPCRHPPALRSVLQESLGLRVGFGSPLHLGPVRAAASVRQDWHRNECPAQKSQQLAASQMSAFCKLIDRPLLHMSVRQSSSVYCSDGHKLSSQHAPARPAGGCCAGRRC